ncbi:hypothetical protein PHYSODRAFT_253793, partial [Phytophthora sojae]
MPMIGVAPPPSQRPKAPPPPSPAGAAAPDPVEEGLRSLERWRKAAEYAEEGVSVSDVMRELREDEDDEDYEEKEAPVTSAGMKTETVAEAKAEPAVKGEPEPPVSSLMGRSSVGQPYALPTDYGYGYGMYADDEEDYHDAMEEPVPTQRGPSRRTDRPTFGWSWSAQHGSGKTPEYGGWSGSGSVVKSPTKSPPPMKKLQCAGSPAGFSKPLGGGMPLQPTTGPTASWTPGTGTAPPALTATPSTSWRGASGLSPSAYNLSTMVSHAVKVLSMFYSDTATVEKARDFWELFEDHTDGFPDRSQLLVFRQKLRGRDADRWWNNSRIKSFRTLKVRFHNQFLSRTADELQRGESVEEWGDRVSDLCESLDYPNPQMRYQLFRRGLRNKRMLATLDESPASDIPEACEWLMFKDMHRPIEEEDEFSDSESKKKNKKSEEAPATTAVEALAEQMKSFMEQQQQWQQQLMQRQWQPPRSPRNRAPVVAATPATQPAGNGGLARRRRSAVTARKTVDEVEKSSVNEGSVEEERVEVPRAEVVVETVAGAREEWVVPGDVSVRGEGKEERRTELSELGEDEESVAEETGYCHEEGAAWAVASDEDDKMYPAGKTATEESAEQGESSARVNEAWAHEGAALDDNDEEAKEAELDAPAGKEDPASGPDRSPERGVGNEEGTAAETFYSLDDENRPVRSKASVYSEEEEVDGDVFYAVSADDEAFCAAPPSANIPYKVPTEEVPPPRSVTAAPLRSILKKEGPRPRWMTEESSFEGKDVPENTEVVEAAEDVKEPPRHARLFTDEELDAMECEASEPSVPGVSEELEEYDKELEDRLHPLDEVELMRKVKENAERAKGPSMEEMSKFLGVSAEALTKMKDTSPEGTSSPEYWEECYRNTLENSAEAKRANRDFKQSLISCVSLERSTEETTYESFGLSESDLDPKASTASIDGSVTEESVTANIAVPVDDCEENSEEMVAAVSVDPPVDAPEPSSSACPSERSEARKAVYFLLKETKDEMLRAKKSVVDPPGEGGTVEMPPVRNKPPDLDWVRLVHDGEQVAGGNEGQIDWREPVKKLANEYYSENATYIWNTLLDRVREAHSASAKRRLRRRSRRPVCFDFTALYRGSSEALDGELRPEEDGDATHYVQVVRPDCPPPERGRKTGLVEVVTVNLPDGFGVRADEDDDESGAELPRIVAGGRRVVCTVGNFEALSCGYIDCLPSQMLADTGATLSLVDFRVLNELVKLWRPTTGIRGWITLSLMLGKVGVTMRMFVADKLHVDAILGVDALGAFGAVIDVAERTLMLKSTGEVLSLGVMVVHESFMATMAVSVRLPPRGQALVVTDVVGDAPNATVLVEGSLNLPPSLCVARTLCTVDDGRVVVEVCNASTEEFWIKKGTVVASTSVVKSEGAPSRPPEASGAATVAASREEEAKGPDLGETVRASRPDVPPDKEVALEADFSQSRLSEEQKSPFRSELERFR